MIEEIEITNKAYGYTSGLLTMNRTDADYLLDDNEGIDWGATSTTFSTIENLSGIGSTINKLKTTDPRPITITGWIIGTEQEIESKKAYLGKVISPMDELSITINDEYYIDVVVTSAVKFAISYTQNNEVMCKFVAALQAPFPFFKKDRIVSFEDLTRMNQIQNHGCSAVGAEFQFHLLNSVSSLVLNVNSQHLIITGEIPSGWYTVSTKEGEKRNGFGWDHWNLESDWPEIPKTLFDDDYAIITVSASGSLSGSTLDVFFSELYTTLEDL